jgi:sirohydrochlorin ferrochelatase
MGTTQPRTALVLVDHGSRSEASNASLVAVAREVAELASGRFVAVIPCHMEIAPPSIADAFDTAVAAGAELVVVALYFLAPGRHSEIDVPQLAAEAAARHAGLAYAVTSSLGPDETLSRLVLARAAETLEAQVS